MKTMSVRRWVASGLLVGAVAVVSSPARATEVDGAESPEAAYSLLQAAAESGDTMAFTRLIAPEARPAWVIQLIQVVGKLVFTAEEKGATQRAWFEVADAHGYEADVKRFDGLGTEPPEEAQAYVDELAQRLLDEDPAKFLAATLTFIDGTMKEQEYGSSFLGSFPAEPLRDVEYPDENRASIQAGGKSLLFAKRDDGRWYFIPQEPVFN